MKKRFAMVFWELLVVIAIIALLACTWLPLLVPAQAAAMCQDCHKPCQKGAGSVDPAPETTVESDWSSAPTWPSTPRTYRRMKYRVSLSKGDNRRWQLSDGEGPDVYTGPDGSVWLNDDWLDGRSIDVFDAEHQFKIATIHFSRSDNGCPTEVVLPGKFEDYYKDRFGGPGIDFKEWDWDLIARIGMSIVGVSGLGAVSHRSSKRTLAANRRRSGKRTGTQGTKAKPGTLTSRGHPAA